jgi:Rho guanine nucleotide exchange factor 7
MGLSVSEEEDVVLPLSGDDQQVTEVNERDTQDSPELVVRARYAFTGEGEDELVFEKGEIISVTKVVEGGWWEGYCNGRVGWFPGVYVEEIPADSLPALMEESIDKRSSLQQFYDLVMNDIVETERAYSNDLQTLLSVYLSPLKTANV